MVVVVVVILNDIGDDDEEDDERNNNNNNKSMKSINTRKVMLKLRKHQNRYERLLEKLPGLSDITIDNVVEGDV